MHCRSTLQFQVPSADSRQLWNLFVSTCAVARVPADNKIARIPGGRQNIRGVLMVWAALSLLVMIGVLASGALSKAWMSEQEAIAEFERDARATQEYFREWITNN